MTSNVDASRALLLVSADLDADLERIARDESPRRDYIELASALDADIIDSGLASRGNRIRRLSRRFGRDLAVVLTAKSRISQYDVVFSDNERAGMLLGALFRTYRRRPRHVMLGHHLSPRKKRAFLRLAQPGIDTLIVHSEPQRRFAMEALGFRADQVHCLPYQVAADFWQPTPEARVDDMICSAGLEFRDYDSLLLATNGLGVKVKIGAASNWSSKKSQLSGRVLPPHVQVRSYNYTELRNLYAAARLVVVPLLENDFQAGVTLILEAMASGKAVVVTRTGGQRDDVRGPLWRAEYESWPAEGPSPQEACGIFVAPGDSAALRSALRFLLARPDLCRLLGANGRRYVEAEFTIERFVERFAAVLRGAKFAPTVPWDATRA
jgi:glycosyltransferase involved in cell wall biosynthesis